MLLQLLCKPFIGNPARIDYTIKKREKKEKRKKEKRKEKRNKKRKRHNNKGQHDTTK
jgi:hypothetical protein